MGVLQRTRIKNKKDTSARWTTNNPLLLNGEIAIEVDSNNRAWMKVGDGVTKYNSLPYASGVSRMRWNGTILEVLDEANVWQPSNLIGPIANHEWNLTKIRFKIDNTTWGEWTEIMPDHEWNITPETKKLRLKKPDGTYGEFVDLSSYNYFFSDDDIGETKEWIHNTLPTDFIRLDGTVINKVDYPEFFSFLLQDGQILETDEVFTLPNMENKLIRVKNSKNELLQVIYDKLVYHNVLSDIDQAQADIINLNNLKAAILSPTFTGIPLAPTAAISTNTTQLATTKFVCDMLGGTTNPVKNLAATGYMRLANGVLMQWGSTTGGSATFPVAFTSWRNVVLGNGYPNTDNSTNITGLSLTGMTFAKTGGTTWWVALGQ